MNYRILEHRLDDRIIISPAFAQNDIISAIKAATVRYTAELSLYGGAIMANRIYKALCIVDASKLDVLAIVFDGKEWCDLILTNNK